MTSRLDRFLFDEANPRSASFLRSWIAVVAAIVFFPSEDASLSSMLRSAKLDEAYGGLFLTNAYWALTAALLGLFATGVRPRVTGLLAVLALAPCVPVLGRLPGRYMVWFALASLSLPRTAPPGPIWPVRLIQVQISVLYLVNGLAKSTPGYLGGGALQAMSQQLPNFHLDLSGGGFPFAGLAIPPWLAAAGSAAVEYALGIGFWFPRLRWPTAALGVAFHLGLKAVVTIGWLDVAAMSLYPAFLLRWQTAAAAPTETQA